MPLESTLRRLAHTVHPPRQDALRREVLQRIEAPFLRALGHAPTPANSRRLREEVFARIALPKAAGRLQAARSALLPERALLERIRVEILGRISRWQPVPLWHRAGKFVAVTAVLTIVVRLTPTLFIATPLQAVAPNTLIPLLGTVAISDGAEWTTVTKRLELTAPFTIRTGSESEATVALGDSAVLRLGENTEVNLRLAALMPPESRDGPIARVSYGQVWVTSLLPDALATRTAVVLPQGTLAMKQGSTNVLADPQQSTVQVFHRFAEVAREGKEVIHLIEGDMLTLRADGTEQHHLLTEKLRGEDWVQANLAKDGAHRTKVAERSVEHAESVAGILPSSDFYFVKLASEKLDLLLTIGQTARQEKVLRNAQTRLNEAVVLLKQGNAKAAESPLAEFRETIRAFASLSEDEARELLASSLIASSATVASALPHSELYAAKKAVVEASSELSAGDLPITEIDLYLLSDALLGIEERITNGNIAEAAAAFESIEPSVESVLTREEMAEAKVGKEQMKALKTILRAIAVSLEQAKETVAQDEQPVLASLAEHVAGKFTEETISVAVAAPAVSCMSLQEITRRTNQFLAAVFTYQTPRGQRNEVLRQLALLPDCIESGRILSKVMNKVPVFTRSFVWEALQKVGTGT